MRIARLGEFEKERAAVIVSDTEAVFVDDVIGKQLNCIFTHA